jgi:hypothetical protein
LICGDLTCLLLHGLSACLVVACLVFSLMLAYAYKGYYMLWTQTSKGQAYLVRSLLGVILNTQDSCCS